MLTTVRTICLSVVLLLVMDGQALSEDSTQSQAGLSHIDCEKYKQLDRRLSVLYAQVLKAHDSDKMLIRKIRKSQQAWLAYRSAQLDMLYPAADKQTEYGSAYPMCNCDALSQMTQLRIVQLGEWLTGIAAGDVCIGSRVEKEP